MISDEVAKMLCPLILAQAIEDWGVASRREARCKGGKEHSERLTTDELRTFFNSEWCDLLLINTGVSGKQILERLESHNGKALHKKALIGVKE